MTATLWRAGLYVVAFGFTAGVAVAASQLPDFRASADMVRVYVTVTDLAGDVGE